jgi:hypothetical protein
MGSLCRFIPVRFNKTALIGLSVLVIGLPTTSHALDMADAAQLVKALPCADNQNVGQILDQSVKSHSQRDIGWRTFENDEHYDVERAVLVSKGMELRYRWRVSADGSISPENHRTETLCSVPAQMVAQH